MNYEDGDHQSGRPGLCVAVWMQVKICRCRLSLQPIGYMAYTCPVCMGLVALYKCYMPLPKEISKRIPRAQFKAD